MKRGYLLASLGLLLLNASTRFALAGDANALPDADKATATDAYTNPLHTTVLSLPGAGKVIISYLLGLLSTIALFFLVYAGVVYITAAGDEKKIQQAKSIITYTVVGLGVALLTYSLLQTVLDILKVNI
jgi:hypothetical protein